VNTVVAQGYGAGTNNCSDLMVELTQHNSPSYFPGTNSITQPSSVPAAGDPANGGGNLERQTG